MTQGHEGSGTAVAGLPELLPRGEFVRWQGAPGWKDLALHGFHVRKLAVYFAILLVARVVVQVNAGTPLADTLGSTALLASLAGAALGFIAFYAWLASRAARYTLTNRRLVIRCGATLPMTINLPFDAVASADLRMRGNGHGDLPFTLTENCRPYWVILWPHVKPWSLKRVRPMLRSVPDARAVGEQVASSLKLFSDDNAADDRSPRIVRDTATAVPTNLSPSAG